MPLVDSVDDDNPTVGLQDRVVYVLHVAIDENGFKFNPSVEDIRMDWSTFCNVISVTGDRSLPSSHIIFDLIKQESSSDLPSDYINVNHN